MRTTHPHRRLVVRAVAALAVSAGVLSPAVIPSAVADTAGDATAKTVVVTGTASDRDDVGGPLDIQRVRDRVLRVDQTHYLVSYRVRTYTPFASERLDHRWRNFDLELDRDGEPGSERTIMIVDNDGVFEAQIISTATREVLATLSASRPNDRAVEISGPRRLLGARSYFWTSNWHADQSPQCGRGDGFPIVCQDSVPDEGWLRLERPAWPEQD
jgi:hypothetical protein